MPADLHAALKQARERILQIAENRRERDKVFALADTAVAEISRHSPPRLLLYGSHSHFARLPS